MLSTSRASLSILNVVSYVEKLLKDREWLTISVQELYQQVQDLHSWTGPLPAKLVGGLPHVHNILDGLGVLTSNEDKENTADHEKDTGDLDLHFTTALKTKDYFRNLTFASNTSSPEISKGRDCEQPTNDDMTPKKALHPFYVLPQPATLPTPPTDDFDASIQRTSQDRMHQDGNRVNFLLQQGWNMDHTQGFFPASMHTEESSSFPHMPWSSGSNLRTTCVQTPTEQYDFQVQQSPLYPEKGPTTQLGQQVDYFSLGMDYPTDSSSAMEFFTDFDKMLEERLLR
jgi:hypothetical protein